MHAEVLAPVAHLYTGTHGNLAHVITVTHTHKEKPRNTK